MTHDLYKNHITRSTGNWRVLMDPHVRARRNHPAGVRQHYSALRDDNIARRLPFEGDAMRRFGRRDEISIRKACGRRSDQGFVSECIPFWEEYKHMNPGILRAIFLRCERQYGKPDGLRKRQRTIDRCIRVTVWGRNLSTIAEIPPSISSGPALDEIALSLIR
jgi:hypothetical protein